ncbi:unnamed protein product [Penicillium palitans]
MEDLEAIKRDYWHNDSQLSESSSVSSQPRVISSHLPSENISYPQSPSTPFSQHGLIDGLPMQDVVNSSALQDDLSSGWTVNLDIKSNGDRDEEGNIPIEQPEQLASDDDTQICPTDVCIICFSEPRRSASNPPHNFPKPPD